MEAFLRRNIKDPEKQKKQEANKNSVASHFMSVCNASPEKMHFVRDMYHDVADTKTVEVPEKFFTVTSIWHLMDATGEMSGRNDRVHAFYENYPFCSINGTRCRADSGIYTYEAIEYLTNLGYQTIVNHERFIKGCIFALYSACLIGWATIIDSLTRDRQYE